MLLILPLPATGATWKGWGRLDAAQILQTAVFASLGIIAAAGVLWRAFVKAAYHRVVSWFEKLEHRFDVIDTRQEEAVIERESDRKAAELRGVEITNKIDNLSGKMDTLTATVHDHHAVLYGSSTRAGLIEDLAYVRGQRDEERRSHA